MHISDGVLPTSVAVGSYVAAAALCAWSARRTRSEELPKVAVVTAAFFVASLIHVPFGPTSVHLLIPGLAGALLGPSAFLAIALGLLLQSLLFQFGGITALGRQHPHDGGSSLGVRLVFSAAQGKHPGAAHDCGRPGRGRRDRSCRLACSGCFWPPAARTFSVWPRSRCWPMFRYSGSKGLSAPLPSGFWSRSSPKCCSRLFRAPPEPVSAPGMGRENGTGPESDRSAQLIQ